MHHKCRLEYTCQLEGEIGLHCQSPEGAESIHVGREGRAGHAGKAWRAGGGH